MKRTMILCLVVSLSMLGGFATFLYMMSRSSDEINHQRRMLENEEIGVLAIQGEQYSRSMSNSTKIEVLGVAGEDVNVLTFPVDSIEQVYEEGHSTKVDGQLSRMREKKEYSFENPLLSYNPYGTNPLSMYIYFKTQSECLVKYTISTQDEDMPDFTRTLQDTNGMGYANHEYSIVGFSPDVVNYLYLELQTMDGNYIDSKVYEIYIPGSGYGNPTRINTTYSDRVQDISNGLYFVYSSDKTSIALYDNAGYLRGEIPLVQGTGIPAIIGDASFTLATSPQSISRITSTGYVSTTVSIPGYSIRESMVDNGMGQILAIASESGRKTVRDTIISIDFTTGAVNKNLDVKKLLRKRSEERRVGKEC